MMARESPSEWAGERSGGPRVFDPSELALLEADAGYYDPDSTDFTAEIDDEGARDNRKEPVLA